MEDTMHLLEALTLIVLTLAAERCVNVPRDIRRNNERVRNRDEDLTTWIKDDKKQARRETLRVYVAESRKTEGPDYSVSQIQGIKNQVLQRYRDQLRDAERVVRDVKLSEQFPHRLVRGITKRPVPGLTAPDTQDRTIAEWETSAQEDHEGAEALRALAEAKRAAGGKPPLRPLADPNTIHV
jgi:hypothetical protein